MVDPRISAERSFAGIDLRLLVDITAFLTSSNIPIDELLEQES
jgi:hypothetical protein